MRIHHASPQLSQAWYHLRNYNENVHHLRNSNEMLMRPANLELTSVVSDFFVLNVEIPSIIPLSLVY